MTEKKRDFLWRSRFAMIKNSKKRRNSHYDKKKNNADYGLLCYFCYIASAIQTVFLKALEKGIWMFRQRDLNR